MFVLVARNFDLIQTINLYLYHLSWVYNGGSLVVDGQFGADMQVSIQNDGPVTLTLESPAGLVGLLLICVDST